MHGLARRALDEIVERAEHIARERGDAIGARVDDLALLVDLVSSGWRGVDQRLARIEANLEKQQSGATVYRIEEHRSEPVAPDQQTG